MDELNKMKEDFSKHPWVLKLMTDQKRRRRDLSQIMEDATVSQHIDSIKSTSRKHERMSRQLENEVDENKKISVRTTKLEVDYERVRWALEESNACIDSLKKELAFSKEQLECEVSKVLTDAQRKIDRYKMEFYRMQEEFDRKREHLRKTNAEYHSAKKRYETYLKASKPNPEMGHMDHDVNQIHYRIEKDVFNSNNSETIKETTVQIQTQDAEPKNLLTEINNEMESLLKQWKADKMK